MTAIHKLDEAFARFDAALRRVETLVARPPGDARAAELASEAESLKREKHRLAHEVDLLRTKASELVDSSRQAVGKIDTAMSRIRAVLHSNAPE